MHQAAATKTGVDWCGWRGWWRGEGGWTVGQQNMNRIENRRQKRW